MFVKNCSELKIIIQNFKKCLKKIKKSKLDMPLQLVLKCSGYVLVTNTHQVGTVPIPLAPFSYSHSRLSWDAPLFPLAPAALSEAFSSVFSARTVPSYFGARTAGDVLLLSRGPPWHGHCSRCRISRADSCSVSHQESCRTSTMPHLSRRRRRVTRFP